MRFWKAAAFAVSAAAAMVLAPAPTLAGKKDNSIVWATDRENPIADPFYINTRELVVIGHYVWDTLLFTDPSDGKFKPVLATSWKWANDTTLEFELRKGVKWHDGSDFSADDVVYTFEHVRKKENAIMNYALLAWIKGAEKIDSHKVRIIADKPFPPALAYLAGLGFIMKKGHYDSAPTKADGKKDFGAVKPNGTGPYRISEMKAGDHITAVRNKDYFKDGYKGTPTIETIKYRTIKDKNTQIAELLTGGIDWLWDVPKDQADRVANAPNLKVENAKTLRVSYLSFDVHGTSGQAFFKDKRVRQAIAHAINKDAIAKNLVGPASTAIHTACHPDQWGCSTDITKYPYDPARAKALLAEAGFPNGFEFDFIAYREREYSEAVIGDLTKVGLKPRLNFMQYTAFLDSSRKGRSPIGHGTWGSNSIPDLAAITAHFFSGGPDDTARDPEVIATIKEADSSVDPEKRRQLWLKVLKRIADEAYWVPLFTYAKYYVYAKDLDFKTTSDEIPPFFSAKWK